jgi:hypothetical protein
MPEYATSEGTANYFNTRFGTKPKAFGRTGLSVSQAGFGCYRVDAGEESHREALGKALAEGINLIDTSTNYADGGSETLVGQALQELEAGGEIERQGTVVVSKVGYLQGKNFELSQARKAEERPFPDLVEYGPGLEHCIHPEFIEDQLSRSLERLKVETLDVYLLHNPEYYLGWAKKQSLPLEEARAEYYRRIEAAFRHLESEAERGRIRFYGISSNTFPNSAEDPEFTSAERVWEIAESISSSHRFGVIQFPMNLLETGAATRANQSGGRTLLDFAREKDLGVLVNRPLNAIAGGELFRLADVETGRKCSDRETLDALHALGESEEYFRKILIPNLNLVRSIRQQLKEFVRVAEVLEENRSRFRSLQHVRDVQSQWVLPRINGVMHYLVNMKEKPGEAMAWVDDHVEKLRAALNCIESAYRQQAARRAATARERAAAVDPDWNVPKLSQLAVRALRSTSGIHGVLVGMRRKEYVDDVLEELSRPLEVRERTGSWKELAAKPVL